MQFTLDLQLCDVSTFENFIAGENKQEIEQIQQVFNTPHETGLCIWGPSGWGKSHLLQACCHQLSKEGKQAIYLPLEQHAHWTPAILEGLEQCDLICLDHIEQIINLPAWEEALFHLYNRARDAQATLMFSALTPPHLLPVQLKDLHSRLTWGISLPLKPLSDQEKARALQMRAHYRGLELSDDCTRYLFNHTTRNMKDLIQILKELDQASLEQQRKITVPFINQILKEKKNVQ